MAQPAIRYGPASCSDDEHILISLHQADSLKLSDGLGRTGPTKRMVSGILLRGNSNASPVHWRNKSGRTHMQSKTRRGMGGAPHLARTAFMWSVAGWNAASNWRFSSLFCSNPSGVVSGCERRPKSTLVTSRGTTPQPTIGGRLFLGPSSRGKAPKYGTSTRIRSIGLSAMIWRIHWS
jgi:hypothetical protein